MAYCTWANVTDIMERAGDIVAASGDQTTVLAEATELADTYLAPLMHTPVEVEADDAYPFLVIRLTALLAADLVAIRRYHGDEDIKSAEYDGLVFTGSKWGHMAMTLLQARRQAKAAVDADVTGPEANAPRLVTSFTTTDGEVEAKYAAGFFEDTLPGVFYFTITSADGDVAGGDLTISCTRDGTAIWTDKVITGSTWINVANGLQVRFIDPVTGAATWTQNDSFTVNCEPMDAVPNVEGVTSREWNQA